MNLSERLDAARKARTGDDDSGRGAAPDADADAESESSPDDAASTGERADLLRMTIDDRTYDGTDLRTGHALTSEHWRERDEDPERRLPSWNPNRANYDLQDDDWHLDDQARPTDTDEAEVINLAPGAAQADDGLELPAWAKGTEVYHPGKEAIAAPDATAKCPSCGGGPELKHLDLLADKADLECRNCGLRWSESAAAHAPKAR